MPPTPNTSHAIVLGGSIAGLLAARVLSDHFARVTLIERDTLSTTPEHRPGAPQAKHIHGLLMRGGQLLEKFFPGFRDELTAYGAPQSEWLRQTAQRLPNGWTPNAGSGLTSHGASRVLIEHLVRRRVRALPNVTFMTGWSAVGLVAADAKAAVPHIVGVRLEPRRRTDDMPAMELRGDLVIDATGRGSHAPQWIEALTGERVEELLIDGKSGYASRWYRLPAAHRPEWNALLFYPEPLPRGGTVARLEPDLADPSYDRWMLTLAGTNGDLPPTDEAGFAQFAASIAALPLDDFLSQAEPISPIVGYHQTTNLRRQYHLLERMPDGFIALGDSVCVFNPVYGQGMTVSAIAADTLDNVLRHETRTDNGALGGGFTKRFQAALALTHETPWQMATTADWRSSTATANVPRPPQVGMLHGYVDWLMDGATRSPYLARVLLESMHLMRTPASLFAPRVILSRLFAPRQRTPIPPGLPQTAPQAAPQAEAV